VRFACACRSLRQSDHALIRRAGCARGKDAGSVDSGAIDATEDAASRRPSAAKRPVLTLPAALSGFAALAIAVALGAFTGLDQWGIEHLMPGGRFTGGTPSLLDSLVPLAGTHWGSAWSVLVNVVTVPASFVVSLAIVARRSRVLAALLVAAVAVETLCKEVLTRPELHHGARHVAAFDDSFPSGHTLRAVIVAGALASPWSAAWAAAAIVLLELAGWHTPTDIAGGVLLGASALLARGRAARALRGRRLARSRAR